MSRISLATDVRTRAGNPDKDARMKNAYIELRGDQSAARKRPSAQGGVVIAPGVPQGGSGLVVFWNDTPYPLTVGIGTTWNGGTSYTAGSHVSVDFVDYWAIDDNIGFNPTISPTHWSRNVQPAIYPLPGWTLGSTTIVPGITGISNSPIAWNGTIYVYLAGNPITPFTSNDGITWTAQPATALGYSNTTKAIIWNGTKFLALPRFSPAGGWTSATSTNGITWVSQFDGTLPTALTDVAWNGSVFCAMNHSNISYTSLDGITWTPGGVFLPGSANYDYIAWNGSVFCATGTTALSQTVAATSPDGVNWTLRTIPVTTGVGIVKTKGNTICIISANGDSLVSNDNGATWSSGFIPGVFTTQCLSAGTPGFLFVSGSASATYYLSTDGITWNSHVLPVSKNWKSTVYGNKYVVMDSTTFSATSVTGT